MNRDIMPHISTYGNYDNLNYGAHCLQVEFAKFTIYYSYETIVAYWDYQDGTVCSENCWGTTTGRHLNLIQPDKKARKSREEFEKMFEAMILRNTNSGE